MARKRLCNDAKTWRYQSSNRRKVLNPRSTRFKGDICDEWIKDEEHAQDPWQRQLDERGERALVTVERETERQKHDDEHDDWWQNHPEEQTTHIATEAEALERSLRAVQWRLAEEVARIVLCR